jgi:hypothetical protein
MKGKAGTCNNTVQESLPSACTRCWTQKRQETIWCTFFSHVWNRRWLIGLALCTGQIKMKGKAGTCNNTVQEMELFELWTRVQDAGLRRGKRLFGALSSPMCGIAAGLLTLSLVQCMCKAALLIPSFQSPPLYGVMIQLFSTVHWANQMYKMLDSEEARDYLVHFLLPCVESPLAY